MEAKCKYDYKATDHDELSFSKNDFLKVLNVEEDKNWYQAEKDGKVGFIPSNHIHFKFPSWYAGGVGRVGSEEILREKDEEGIDVHEEGTFLVRMSENVKGGSSISVKCGNEVQHFKVNRTDDKYRVWSRSFKSLNDCIHFYRTTSISKTCHVLLTDRKLLKVVANYDYKPQDSEELELKRGDVVVVTKKQDDNWWEGQVVRGSTVSRGLFPMTYVTVISH